MSVLAVLGSLSTTVSAEMCFAISWYILFFVVNTEGATRALH
jgi:hypothetical protein